MTTVAPVPAATAPVPAAAATTPATSQSPPSTSSSTAPTTRNLATEPLDSIQTQQIKDLFAERSSRQYTTLSNQGASEDEANALIKKWWANLLEPFGVTSIKNLSHAAATRFIQKLQHEEEMDAFEQAMAAGTTKAPAAMIAQELADANMEKREAAENSATDAVIAANAKKKGGNANGNGAGVQKSQPAPAGSKK